jgi:hypothetical protein
MKIRTIPRAATVALLSASAVVAVDGCSATAKKMSSPQPAAAEEASKKEYKWQDMSTGKSFFRPIKPPEQ